MGQIDSQRSKKSFVIYKVHSVIYYSTSVVLNLMKGKLMGKWLIRPLLGLIRYTIVKKKAEKHFKVSDISLPKNFFYF